VVAVGREGRLRGGEKKGTVRNGKGEMNQDTVRGIKRDREDIDRHKSKYSHRLIQ
jgi:hypothetical protein